MATKSEKIQTFADCLHRDKDEQRKTRPTLIYMKIKVTQLKETLIEVPTYFTLENNYCRLNYDETFFVIRKWNNDNDYSFLARETNLDFSKPITEITKAEFVAHCNKAYKAITGFKHAEELWIDEEADTHHTQEIDLLSQCEIFIAGVQSYLGNNSGQELLNKIKQLKK